MINIQSKPTDHDKRMQSSSKAADVSHMMGLSYRLVVSSTGLYHNEIKRLNGLKSAHEETVKSIASQINHAI